MNLPETKEELQRLLGGKIFRVTFLKKDGSERTLRGRFGVHKYVKGTGIEKPAGLVTIYTWPESSYRSFYFANILRVTCGPLHMRAANGL